MIACSLPTSSFLGVLNGSLREENKQWEMSFLFSGMTEEEVREEDCEKLITSCRGDVFQ
jgi:hypothetical protein